MSSRRVSYRCEWSGMMDYSRSEGAPIMAAVDIATLAAEVERSRSNRDRIEIESSYPIVHGYRAGLLSSPRSTAIRCADETSLDIAATQGSRLAALELASRDCAFVAGYGSRLHASLIVAPLCVVLG